MDGSLRCGGRERRTPRQPARTHDSQARSQMDWRRRSRYTRERPTSVTATGRAARCVRPGGFARTATQRRSQVGQSRQSARFLRSAGELPRRPRRPTASQKTQIFEVDFDLRAPDAPGRGEDVPGQWRGRHVQLRPEHEHAPSSAARPPSTPRRGESGNSSGCLAAICGKARCIPEGVCCLCHRRGLRSHVAPPRGRGVSQLEDKR